MNRDNNILTVYCPAYNHEKYITKALEGFVNQKTEYKYNVIVHDDASTDKTPTIIKEYAHKYPDLIFPIFQSENQYSKGVNIFKSFVEQRLTSKYIATCEGDDFWCDNKKIQQQIEYMESHDGCSLCVHNTMKISSNDESKIKPVNKNRTSTDYYIEDIIESGGGGLFHTSSFVYRTELIINKPKEFYIKSIGDYPNAIYLASCGYVHYFPEIMSCYRVNTPGSWTVRTMFDPNRRKIFYKDALEGLEKMNRYLNYEYCESFNIAKKPYLYGLMTTKEKMLSGFTDIDYFKMLFDSIRRNVFKKQW